MIDIDLALIRKYDKPGPRYTSYPTAPHFSESFGRENFLEALRLNNYPGNTNPLSLYFHLPFCDTQCYFCGCSMILSKNRGRINTYVKYLIKEIDLFIKNIDSSRRVNQIHWGGGTPTHLLPEEILELAGAIRSRFNISHNSESGCEIDPRELTKTHLEALRESGFNRISMGVQDFSEKVQRAVNRIQPEEMTLEVVEWVRDLGFSSLNIDLMYGLPFQTEESFNLSVDKVIGIRPERIALFNYAHLPWLKKHMTLIKEQDLPSAEEKLQIFKSAAEKLTSAGYIFIGMDHFALPEDELSVALNNKKLYRNFQGYSTNAGADLYGFGITSIGNFDDIYSQNLKTEKEYYDRIDKNEFAVFKGYKLNEDDLLRRRVISKIMCDFEIDFKMTDDNYGVLFKDYFSDSLKLLKTFQEDGLIEMDSEKIRVTGKGRFLIRNIAMCFDAFLLNKEDNTRYSRTI